MDEKKLALLIGRYQPFHNGHLETVKEIMQENLYNILIVIGSAQESHTLDNPFTAGERHSMIAQALEAIGITKYTIIPIIDQNRYAIWVSHVESLVPKFDTVFTNNPLTKRLFGEKGYEVRVQKSYDRDKYSGTEIRRRMMAGEDWGELVPEAVFKLIEKINGVERLKELVEK